MESGEATTTRYELASTRHKIWNLLFMLFFSLLMSYFILSAPYFDLFMAFLALGDVLVIFLLQRLLLPERENAHNARDS